MANDMMDTLRSILGDNADEKIQNVLTGLSTSNTGNDIESSEFGLENPSSEYISQIKNIFSQMQNANDTRSNLLLSLKPYMRSERQKSIDNAVRILNLTRISGFLK